MNINHITGCVTSANKELCTFYVDNSTLVNASCLLYHQKCFYLPQPGETVSITDFHCIESGTVYLCGKSEMDIDRANDDENSEEGWIWTQKKRDGIIDSIISELAKKYSCKTTEDYPIVGLIEEYKLGIADLIKIYSNFTEFVAVFQRKWGLSAEILTLRTVPLLINNSFCRNSSLSTLQKYSCMNRVLPDNQLLSISKFRYVDIMTEKYEDFPYWSFGIHPSLEGKESLIGYLYVQENYGIPMIKDVHRGMLCLIISNSSQNLRKYFGSFVVVKKFVVITEIYKSKETPNLEYLLINFNDVEIIENTRKECPLSERVNKANTHKHCMIFYLESESVPKYSKRNVSEYWLQVEIIKSDVEFPSKLFLRLDSIHMKLLPLLKHKSVYKLCYNQHLTKVTPADIEIQRFYTSWPQYKVSDPSIDFTEENSAIHNIKETVWMNVEQCKTFIAANPTAMVSFEGKVKTKRFVDSISSRTERNIPVYGFGTPGVKTHYVEFAVEDSNVKTLNLYFNNWESSLIPFGFVPDMKIRVKNVVSQKGKYLKSTPMTSFEMIEYQPSVLFTTTNLFSGCEECWARLFYFGLGNHIPYGALITGEVSTIVIKSLKITNFCLTCKQVTQNKQCMCSDVENAIFKLDIMMTMFVKDIYGEAKIIAKCEDLLRILLNFEPHEFSLWRKDFENIGKYEYDAYNDNVYGRSKQVKFSQVMTSFVKTVNVLGIISGMQLCCRKLDFKSGDNKAVPLWFCLKARKK